VRAVATNYYALVDIDDKRQRLGHVTVPEARPTVQQLRRHLLRLLPPAKRDMALELCFDLNGRAAVVDDPGDVDLALHHRIEEFYFTMRQPPRAKTPPRAKQAPAAAAPAKAPVAKLAPKMSAISGDMKGQTMALLSIYNPPEFFLCGDQAPLVAATIERAILRCVEERHMGILRRKSKGALAFEEHVRSCGEPVYHLALPVVSFDAMRQSLVTLAVLDEMDGHREWRSVIDDSTVEEKADLAAQGNRLQKINLQLAGGSRHEESGAKEYKHFHRLLFIHR
jgi:hypothetical protein